MMRNRNWSIDQGFDVFDVDDKKVGTVGAIAPNHFSMDTGFLGLGKNHNIPFSAISDVRDGKVFLKTSKDNLDSIEVHIEHEADMGVTGMPGTTTSTGMGDWGGVSSGYRSRWQSRYGNQPGAHWEDYEPSYRYGWEMSSRPEYRGKRWNEVEPEFRRDWGSRHSDKPWDRFGDAIRDAWESRGDDRSTKGSGMSTSFGERGDFTQERTIPLREEELNIERSTRQAGEVRISKDIEEKRVSKDVPYTREEVHIERRPVTGEHTSDEPIRSDSETIRVPVHEEEIDVHKRTVTREELVVGKDRVQEQKRVEETLRREVPRIEKEGDIKDADHLSEEERRRGGLGLSEEERRRRERGNL